jgi:hypothetical protein
LKSRYQSVRRGKAPFCDGRDAKRVRDADWISRIAMIARIDGELVDVPNEAVGSNCPWPCDGLASLDWKTNRLGIGWMPPPPALAADSAGARLRALRWVEPASWALGST